LVFQSNLAKDITAADTIEKLTKVCSRMSQMTGFFHPCNNNGTTIKALPNSYTKDSNLNLLVFQALCENVKLLLKQLGSQKQSSTHTTPASSELISQWSDLSHLSVCRFENNQNKQWEAMFSSHHQALKDHASSGIPGVLTNDLSGYRQTLGDLKTAKGITQECLTWSKYPGTLHRCRQVS
jgi:hypothetical protein